MYSFVFQFFVNTTKVGFWFVLSFFFFSSPGVDDKLTSPSTLEDVHFLNREAISDSVGKIIESSLVFSVKEIKSRDGDTFTNVELKASGTKTKGEQLFGMIISKPTKNTNAILGKHEVKGDFNSLLSNFSGVFGFVNLTDLDEKPYFGHKGFVHIAEIDQHAMRGKMNLSFRNSEGKTIHVSRSFMAYKN